LAIDLTVEEYCSDCYDFEAEVIKPERLLQCTGKSAVVVRQTDTIIRCKYARRCENLRRYLEKQMSKEG
jgi:hypothetical protein